MIEDTTSSLKKDFRLELGLPIIPKLDSREIDRYCGITIL